VTHLMELLKAHESRDAEASRLQQALQCQEEADAAKLVELMRRQEAASAAAVEEAKAAIEAQLVERFREEQAAAAEAHSAQLQQLSAEHSTQLQQAAALLEAQAREKFETAVAHERVIAREAQEQAVLAERLAYLSALKQLELDVDVLTRVLAHDSSYKSTSHAVLQLSAALRPVDGPLPSPASSGGVQRRALADVAARLEDDLLSEMSKALASSPSAPATLQQLQERFVRVQYAGQQATLVPEGGGMWGHALAGSVARALQLAGIKRGPDDARFAASGVLARASDWVDQGNLLEAVREVRTLHGQPASACAGWLAAAEERLLVEQVRAVSQAEVDVTVATMC